jgi:hypothetical protein
MSDGSHDLPLVGNRQASSGSRALQNKRIPSLTRGWMIVLNRAQQTNDHCDTTSAKFLGISPIPRQQPHAKMYVDGHLLLSK